MGDPSGESGSIAEGPLNDLLWQLFWINLLTPSLPWLFPVRMALTVGAVARASWWAVVVVSTAGGTLGMIPSYAIARWAIPDSWRRRLEAYPHWERYRRWARSHMFLLQVLLTATPTPHLVSSGLAGLAGYSVLPFLLAQAIGQGSHNSMLVAGGVFLRHEPWFVRFEDLARNPVVWLPLIALMAIVWLARRVRWRADR